VLKFYTAAGLCVGSEIELPGMLGMEPRSDTPDILFRLGDVPESLPNAVELGPTWQIDEQRFLIRIPNVARFLVCDGREILVAPEAGTPLSEVAIFLSGTVLGILLHQRAHVVLHASAVEVGGKAVLFCGSSGAGKSTLAATLNKRGYPVIADDFSAIGFSPDGVPQVLPDGRNLKLWADATQQLDLQPGAQVRASTNMKKYYVEPQSTAGKPLPLGAIYELAEWRPPRVPGIASPNVVDASRLIRRNAYRPRLVKQMQQEALYFAASARLGNVAGIFVLTRPLDFAQMDATVGWLTDHWLTLGLLEKVA